MGDAFIVRRGGGLSNAFAAISVTYPSGSTCTCAKGTKTLTAKDTSGHFLFLVPESGTWTVSCSGKSQTVNVTSYGQTFEVTIATSLYLIQNGAFASGVSFSNVEQGSHGSMTARSGYIEQKTAGANHYCGRAYRLDVTSYTKISVEWQLTDADLNLTSLAVFRAINVIHDSTALSNNVAAESHPSRTGSRITTTLSLSGFSGNQYVGTYMINFSNAATAQIYNMWLE